MALALGVIHVRGEGEVASRHIVEEWQRCSSALRAAAAKLHAEEGAETEQGEKDGGDGDNHLPGRTGSVHATIDGATGCPGERIASEAALSISPSEEVTEVLWNRRQVILPELEPL